MARRFLDTNILLRYLTRDDEAKAQQALALLRRVERDEEQVETSLLVLFEVIFTLERFYRIPRTEVRNLLTPILSLRGLRMPGKQLVQETLDQSVDARPGISFTDIYNAVYARSRGIEEIYSWDTDFDDLPEITRVEPESRL